MIEQIIFPICSFYLNNYRTKSILKLDLICGTCSLNCIRILGYYTSYSKKSFTYTNFHILTRLSHPPVTKRLVVLAIERLAFDPVFSAPAQTNWALTGAQLTALQPI